MPRVPQARKRRAHRQLAGIRRVDTVHERAAEGPREGGAEVVRAERVERLVVRFGCSCP